ncbi:PhoX family protein [Pendulispora albinea]|uniref:PhoX family phosphatase n=1 Tax=Pendulispora albinea TaxID=2741071 RepID=A0ABZ2LKX9_9BACT
MSYLTDRARAAGRNPEQPEAAGGQSFDDVLAEAHVTRRTMLRGSVGASLAALFGGTALNACSSDDTLVHPNLDGGGPTLGPDASVRPGTDAGIDAGPSGPYAVQFKKIARSTADTVVVPEGYSVDVLFAAGDAVVPGATPFTGTFLTSGETEKIAGGNHDGMAFFELPGVDPNKGGLLAINHEAPDLKILIASASYDRNTPDLEQRKIVLSSVGVSVIEIELKADGKWGVKANSTYNKRYTGNTEYRVSGPAASTVGPKVVGTLNNCSSGRTPWGTYLTCEETSENYLIPADSTKNSGYGWVVEIDPRGELADLPVKRTALGRFDHENIVYLLGSDNSIAFYMGDDGTPGCIYKFIPSAKFDPNNRAANANLLDLGTLYAAKFNPDGTGQWVALVQGQNGLVTGAMDPGNETQGEQPDTKIDFNAQADVLVNTKAAARVAGATLMDRPEWITVGPDKTFYCTLTNNGGRKVVHKANPRVQNLHGHIVKWTEASGSPTATTFSWEVFLLAGDPSIAKENLAGNIDGDTFSSPDGLYVDPQGRLWVQTDMNLGASGDPFRNMVDVFGNNSMYYVDPVTKKSSRFLAGPKGCEITGITHTPDLKTFFINIQHPDQGAWPSNVQDNKLPPRSATVVVRRIDGKPVGA